MEERSTLSNLANYTNVRGEEAVNRRVAEETMTLEELEDSGDEYPPNGRPDPAAILRGSFGSSGRPCVYSILLVHHGQSGKFIETPSTEESSGQDVSEGSRPLHL